MNGQMIWMISTWLVLVIAYVVLAIYRKQVEKEEFDNLHVMADANLISKEESMAHRMDVLDRWAKVLVSVIIVYGLIIAGAYMYQAWNSFGTIQ